MKGGKIMKDYKFNGSISLEVLNNYLSRSVNMGVGAYSKDETKETVRFILSVGAKYILRAAGQWYPDSSFENSFDDIKTTLSTAHATDPDIIFEACIFEVSNPGMGTIQIPPSVFEAFGLKPENRCFDHERTVFSDGYGVDYWEKGHHIPDITTTEMQMFVYYRACKYIDAGFEALHLGQVLLTGKNDPKNTVYTKLIRMIREYAKAHARRGYVLINAHNNEFKDENGIMLADMIVVPTRVHAPKDEVNHAVSENNPQRCIIEPGYWGKSSIYNQKIPGTSPSGWFTENYPYLAHLDNYGDVVGDTSDKDCYVWGKDEAMWFVVQPAWYRREFMRYIKETIDGYNENGHISFLCRHGVGKYFANNKSAACPEGSGDEETIKQIFSEEE